MPKFCHRLKTLEAIERSPIHQSLSSSSLPAEASSVAMARCRSAILGDPKQARVDTVIRLNSSEITG